MSFANACSYNTYLHLNDHFKALELVAAYAIIRPTETPPSIQLVETTARKILDKRTNYKTPCKIYDWWYKRGLPDPDAKDEGEADDGTFDEMEEEADNDDNDDGDCKDYNDDEEEDGDEDASTEVDTFEETQVLKSTRRKVGKVNMADEAIITRKKSQRIDALTRAILSDDDASSEEEPLAFVMARVKKAVATRALSEQVRVYVSGKQMEDIAIEDTIVVQPLMSTLPRLMEQSTTELPRDTFKIQEAVVATKASMRLDMEHNIISPTQRSSSLFGSSPISPLAVEEGVTQNYSSKSEATPFKKPSKREKTNMEKFMKFNQEYTHSAMLQPLSHGMPLPVHAIPYDKLTPKSQKYMNALKNDDRLSLQDEIKLKQQGIQKPSAAAAVSSRFAAQQVLSKPKMMASPTKSSTRSITNHHKENTTLSRCIIPNVQDSNSLYNSSRILTSSTLGKHARLHSSHEQQPALRQKTNTYHETSPNSKRAPPTLGVTGHTGSANRAPPRNSTRRGVDHLSRYGL